MVRRQSWRTAAREVSDAFASEVARAIDEGSGLEVAVLGRVLHARRFGGVHEGVAGWTRWGPSVCRVFRHRAVLMVTASAVRAESGDRGVCFRAASWWPGRPVLRSSNGSGARVRFGGTFDRAVGLQTPAERGSRSLKTEWIRRHQSLSRLPSPSGMAGLARPIRWG